MSRLPEHIERIYKNYLQEKVYKKIQNPERQKEDFNRMKKKKPGQT